MHYYKFNIADYRKDTGHLTTLEHGIYRQLIDWHYLDEKPIPEETQVVCRRLRLVSESELLGLQNVLNDFFELTPKGYVQRRIVVEIADYHEQADKNKANGKLGGRPKKTQVVSSGLPDESQNNPNHKPLTINHKPKNTVMTPPNGVSDIVWQDFVKHRKAKRAQITERVISDIATQAKLAGWTLEAALSETTIRNWQTFKAAWVEQKTIQQKFDVARTTVPARQGRDPALVKAENDFANAKPPSLEVLAKMAELRKTAVR